MTAEELTIKKDRMRYTKNSLSGNLVICAIVFDALYFISIYSSDVGSYYYSWVIGVSIVYNLLFLLSAFLASESVRNRKTGYSGFLMVAGVLQIGRVFYLPMNAHSATVSISGADVAVMENGQFVYVTVLLVLSGICCIVAGITSYKSNKTLAEYMRSIEKQPA